MDCLDCFEIASFTPALLAPSTTPGCLKDAINAMPLLYGYPVWYWLTGAAAAATCYLVGTAFSPSRRISFQQIQAEGGQAFITSDGRLLEYFVHGKPNGKTVLLAIHGAQTTGKLFSILHDWALENDVRIVSPTLPGFGLSPFHRLYTPREWVRDLQELLAHLKVHRFHVLGTSLGSIHAAAVACLFEPREAVDNVLLYVAFAPQSDTHDPLKGSILAVFGNLRRYPLRKRLLEKTLFMPMLRLLVPKDSDVSRSIRYQWEGAAACADIIYQPWDFDWQSMAAQTGRSPRRVIIVSGRQDVAAPPHNQHRLQNCIAGSELIEVDGAHERAIQEPALMISHVKLLLEQK
jgi:pimeloyl-ACP methyl ester carboxylesterase